MPAKQTEVSNWKRNDVFEEVKDEGQKCISTRWVCTLKETPDGVVPKARSVARGFKDMTLRSSQKTHLHVPQRLEKLSWQKKWQLNSIKAAFCSQPRVNPKCLHSTSPQSSEQRNSMEVEEVCLWLSTCYKVEDTFTAGNARKAWQGLNIMMGRTVKSAQIQRPDSATFAEQLNTYYGRFNKPSARKDWPLTNTTHSAIIVDKKMDTAILSHVDPRKSPGPDGLRWQGAEGMLSPAG